MIRLRHTWHTFNVVSTNLLGVTNIPLPVNENALDYRRALRTRASGDRKSSEFYYENPIRIGIARNLTSVRVPLPAQLLEFYAPFSANETSLPSYLARAIGRHSLTSRVG